MKMQKKELFRMIRGLEANFGELRSKIIAHGAQIRFLSNRIDKMPNHQEELLKQIEELEQAVALLQQKVTDIENRPITPVWIAPWLRDVPPYTYPTITCAQTTKFYSDSRT